MARELSNEQHLEERQMAFEGAPQQQMLRSNQQMELECQCQEQQQQQQQQQGGGGGGGGGRESLVQQGLLPLQSSPYLRYTDLGDYKQKAYGADRYLHPKLRHDDGIGTDAPTLDGTDLSHRQSANIDSFNRKSK
ncbi:unnamed protein product [Ilex paraguariensis]|uniref:Uncharacterized protein n=1 Tax=Ilex paraguariensis TaxID=185542 RepID=A0ABC8U9U4_9AQUA